jgi:tRNA (adenine57-N1/adenine58-N1)-methyltransferase catalytic subunit
VSGPFRPGERALLMDARGRRFMIRLRDGETFHFHGGSVGHDVIIGQPEGVEVRATGGGRLACLRPTMADFVLKMPRGAQVVYPKDIGAILVHGDVFPGARVLEAGTGSAAVTLALARATGPGGCVVSYEAREDHHRTAVNNVESFFGSAPAWVNLRMGDVRDVAGTGERFDRVVLDLPEPWAVLPEVAAALEPGGILCSYLPTTNQTRDVVLALDRAGFTQVDSFEVLMRHWHVTERSVRPDHRMVAHTGFITTARRPVAVRRHGHRDDAESPGEGDAP